MTNRLMIKGLIHERPGIKDAEFFTLIDSLGGWPVGYKFVGFEHTDERKAGFCNVSHNDGWWTVVNSADDYYMWKLSPDAMQRIVDAAIRSANLITPIAHKISVKSLRGYATLQQPAA